MGSALLAVEQVGAGQHLLDLSVEYAKSRLQFGRPIGSFQAVKHRLADLLVDVEHARSTAYHAVWALTDGSDDPALAASIAQAICSAAFSRIATDTIQVHGGIGFTWEHQAHLYFKRATTDAALLGSAEQHRSRVAELVLDTAEAERVPGWPTARLPDLDGKCCAGFLFGELEHSGGGVVVAGQRGAAEHHQGALQRAVVADVAARRNRLADAVQRRRRARVDVVGEHGRPPS